jgi:hypothetical protein
MSSIGSTVSGLLDSYATLFSIALQYNIPLEELLEHMAGPIFPPQGMTSNPKIRSVNSVLGYLYHFLRLKFIDIEDISIEGVSSSIIPMADTGVSIDGEPCPRCGGLLYWKELELVPHAVIVGIMMVHVLKEKVIAVIMMVVSKQIIFNIICMRLTGSSEMNRSYTEASYLGILFQSQALWSSIKGSRKVNVCWA